MALFNGGLVGGLGWAFRNRTVLLAIPALWDEFSAIEAGWDTPAGLKSRLIVLVKASKLVAGMTATPADDALVAEFEKLANSDELIAFVAGVLARFGGDTEQAFAALSAGPDAEQINEEMALRNIDWTKLLAAIKAIVELISMFSGGTVPAGSTSDTSDKPASGNPFDFLVSPEA